jgi:hypothetical protein
VRFTYIDEAGISRRDQEPFLVVGGIVVHVDNDLNGIENQLQRIFDRHVPARLRNDFVFSAKEVFNGGKVLKREKDDFIGPREWPIERRQDIARDILSILKKFKLPIALGFMDRATFPKDFDFPENMPVHERTIAEHVSTYMACAMMVEHWMRQNASNENCFMVVENTDTARKMITDVQHHRQDKRLQEKWDSIAAVSFPLRKIKHNPHFEPKGVASPLVLADFCAYVFKKFLMKNKNYDSFFELFRPLIISFENSYFEKQTKRLSQNSRQTHQHKAPERPL